MINPASLVIETMSEEHYPYVKEIYELGIKTGNATFQASAPDCREWDNAHLKHSRIISLSGGKITGWAALTPVSGRCVYAGVAEVSVYVHTDFTGLGIGKKLLEALVSESESKGIWTLQAGIFPENTASLKLHYGAGFVTIGTRKRIGQMNGIWRDTVLLERRSVKIGI